MKIKLIVSLVTLSVIIQSCDPGGTSVLRNNSSDTLKLLLVGNYNSDTIAYHQKYCKSWYDTLSYSNEIISNRDIKNGSRIMEIMPSKNINDSVMEIIIPPKSTIITNSGRIASRLFKSCAADYVIFMLGKQSDTLFNIANYSEEDIIAFYHRNDIKIKSILQLMHRTDITDIYKLKNTKLKPMPNK